MKGMSSSIGNGDALLSPPLHGGDPADAPDGLESQEESPWALSLLRSSCDSCWKKKCKCSGEMPCSRCRRAGGQCTYSTKRKLGRPRGLAATAKLQAQQACESKKGRKEGSSGEGGALTHQFSATPVTGLGGLAESRFLSCFLEHFTPMFPVANEVSIRDGLMHSFAGMWYGGTPALRGQEAFRGRALECAFFSSVAIGGLLTGHSPDMVKNHVESAQLSVVEFRGLADKHAVSALILSGMMNILLPPGATTAAAAGGGAGGTTNANADGRRSLDEAEEIFKSLPEKDPLVGVILSFRRLVESLASVDAAALCPPPYRGSVSPDRSSSTSPAPAKKLSKRQRGAAAAAAAKASTSSGEVPVAAAAVTGASEGEGGGGGGGSGSGAASAGGSEGSAEGKQVAVASAISALITDGVAHTEEGKAILAGQDISRGDTKCVSMGPPAHPSFVASDALLLSVRFMRGEGTGGISQLRHVHDFVASELNRLVPARAGALVLISLAGTLLAIKTRLQLTDGMLPMAELTTAMLAKCPGWGRSYGRHAAHLSLSVFRLYGLKDAYDALSALLRKTSATPIPAFDDRDAGGGHVCGLSGCKALSESLLALPPPDASDDVARSGTGGGGVSSSGSGSSGTGSRKSNRKRPESALPPRGGASKRQRSASARNRPAAPEDRPRAQEPTVESKATESTVTEPEAAAATVAEEPAGSEGSAAGATSEAAAAAAWKLAGSRSTAALSDVTASPSVSSSPGASYFASATSAGPSSPSTADVAAAAAAVASATATAVAAATSAAADTTTKRSSDQHDLPTCAPGFAVERTGSACEVPVVSEGHGALWPQAAWEDGRMNGAAGQGGYLGGLGGMKNNNINNRSHEAHSEEQGCFLPPLGMLHAQSGSGNFAGVRGGDHNGGGGAGFVSESSRYAATQCRHDPRDVINEPVLLGKPGAENYHQAQQRRIEDSRHRFDREMAETRKFEQEFGGGGGGGGYWPVQGSDAVSTTTTAGRTMAWTDPNAREVMPAWFGGLSGTGGAGPITLPPPDRSSNFESGGGGDWRQPNISVAAAAAAAAAAAGAHQWPSQRPPGSDGSFMGGRVGGAGKMMGSRHVRVPSFRAGGVSHMIGTNPPYAHVRRASGRGANGNEFDFVYELGMLLGEEEFPGGAQPGGR